MSDDDNTIVLTSDHSNKGVDVKELITTRGYELAESLLFLRDVTRSPLIQAAIPIVAILIQLKRYHETVDLILLRQQLLSELKTFSNAGARLDVAPTSIILGRYVLATVADEFIMNAAWSRNSNWDEDPLTSILFDDTAGGDKFFAILERLSREANPNLDLMSLMYICLSLGFEGKYHVMDHGLERLAMVRENLYRTIKQSGDVLSENISDVRVNRVHYRKLKLPTVPWSKVFLVTVCLLGVTYFCFWGATYSYAKKIAYHVEHILVTGGFKEGEIPAPKRN